MNVEIEALFSALASDGRQPSFPEPDVRAAFNFDMASAAPESFPKKDLMRLIKLVFDRDGPDALSYFDPVNGNEEFVFGYHPLRMRLAERIKAMQGRNLGPTGIILTSGSAQGISLAVDGYVNAGDVVMVEAAASPYALRYMAMAGADVRRVPIDHKGMEVEAVPMMLDEIAGGGKRVKMVYTMPTFQTPTNTEMSLSRRHHLLDLARKHGFVIVEDDIYGELRFAGDNLPSLLSMDDSGLVIQCGSFSKIVSPGLRLGWMAGDPRAIGALATGRQYLGVSPWLARVMDEYLKEGLLEPHLVGARAIYKAKATVAVKAMREHCSPYVKFREPRGSFYLWVEIDNRVDWPRATRLAEREGIVFGPGERFSGKHSGRQFLRLAYSQISEQAITDGIAKLGSILRACARH